MRSPMRFAVTTGGEPPTDAKVEAKWFGGGVQMDVVAVIRYR